MAVGGFLRRLERDGSLSGWLIEPLVRYVNRVRDILKMRELWMILDEKFKGLKLILNLFNINKPLFAIFSENECRLKYFIVN